MTNSNKLLITWLLAIVLCLCAVTFPVAPLIARAEGNENPESQTGYESTNVLDDLNGSTIHGKPFALQDYPYDESGVPTVISFVEYCYSYYTGRQQNYGLYVYIYNPQGYAFDTETERNMIELSCGGDGHYQKYPLRFLNYSEEAGSEGMFYKFKIAFTDEQKNEVFASLNKESRGYRIGGIELSYGKVVTDYVCGQVYTYSGYAKGYGSFTASESTLECVTDGIKNYLTLDVRSSYYRPKGPNGKGYTQDTLHSVYFSVPDDVLEEYGEMTAVHATWLDALINPALVTGNRNVYDAITPYLGKNVDGGNYQLMSKNNANTDLKYSLIASKLMESADWNNAARASSYLSYNTNRKYTKSDVDMYYLYYCFLAENGDADNYTLTADKLFEWFESYTKAHGGELVNNRFSRALFASVADRFTDVNITADKTFELTDEIVSQDLWQKFIGGGYNVTGTNTYTVSAIKKVENSDFKSGVSATCSGLYIAESDYDAFRSYYDEATAKNETVFLFRYCQTDYKAYEVAEYERTKDNALIASFDYRFVDTNAYFMQMRVQLDFDIIDLTFTKDDVSTVIPCVSSPIDVAADATPPIITNNDDDIDWWKILLGILLAVLLLILLAPILPYIIKAALWVLCLPFRIIGALFKAIFGRKRKAKEPKEKKEKKPRKEKRSEKSKVEQEPYDFDFDEDWDWYFDEEWRTTNEND